MDRELLSEEFQKLIRKLDNDSNTPEFIIASFLIDSMESLHKAIRRRDQFWNNRPLITKRTLGEIEGELKTGERLLNNNKGDEYVEGVVAALSWVLGITDDQPIEE